MDKGVELISTEDFHRSPGLEGWRVVAGGPTAYFAATDYADAAALVADVARLGAAVDRRPHCDLRADGVTVQLTIFGPEGDGLDPTYVDLALKISTAAGAYGLRAEPSVPQTLQFCIDALDIVAVSAFWRAVLGGYIDRDGPTDLIDPRWRLPTVDFQQMDAPRPQRNRIHIDLYLPYDQAEPRVRVALAAGGRIVRDNSPYWWVLADPEGNEVCVVPIGSGGEASASDG